MWKHRPPSRSDSKSGTVDSGERGFFGWSKKKSPLCKSRPSALATAASVCRLLAWGLGLYWSRYYYSSLVILLLFLLFLLP